MSEIKYISLFSGIEAASVAWEPLGWKPVAFSEIEPFPCSVLAKRFPQVPNLGDITKIDWKKELDALGEEKIDVVIGGSPCQSFSVAGNREGLQGESRLMFEYIRAIQEIRPETLLWENVPGALSSDDGRAFQQLLQSLDELGYGLAWRVLDAQFFGVAQRRRRVFLVGCLGDPGRAAEVLFEPDSLRWDHPTSREKRKELAGAAEIGAGSGGGEGDGGTNCLTPWDTQTARVYKDDDASWTLQCNGGVSGLNRQSVLTKDPTYAIQGNMVGRADSNGPQGAGVSEDVSYTLNTIDQHCVAFSAGQSAKAGSIGAQEDVSPTLRGAPSGSNMTPTVCYKERQVDPDDVLPFNQGQITSRYNGNNPQFGDPCHTISAQDSHAPTVICRTSGQANSELDEDCCGTLAQRAYKDPPIVAFQQNQRDEVRLMNGDGDVSGAIASNPGMHNQNYIVYEDVPNVIAYKQNANEEVRAIEGHGDVAGALVSQSRTRQTIVAIENKVSEDETL